MLKKPLFVMLFLFSGLIDAKEPFFLEGCPVVQLSGKVYHSIVAGPPNYEDISNGDFPCEKWFFEPNDQSKKYLRESGVFETIPDDFRPVADDWKDNVDSIQIAASEDIENRFKSKANKEFIVEGWLGSWSTCCYSIFFFEISKILN